jgi:hypothetical protein
MASFDLTRFVTPEQNSIDDALALIEAHMELIDNAKTIRWIEVVTMGGQSCVGYCIHDT